MAGWQAQACAVVTRVATIALTGQNANT